MKKYYFLIIVALILGLVLTGCLLSNVGQVPTSEQSGITYLTKGVPPTPSTSLVGLWHFDGDALDSSGNGNDGIISGATDAGSANAMFGDALSFNGMNNYVKVVDPTNLDVTDYTLELWINANDLTNTYPTLLNRRVQSGGVGYYWIWIKENKIVLTYTNGSTPQSASWSTPFSIGEWYHIALTKSGSSFTMYKNCSNLGTKTLTYVDAVGGDLFIGTYQGSTVAWYNFDGIIDEVRIWNTALTEPQIAQSYALGTEQPAGGATVVELGQEFFGDEGDEVVIFTSSFYGLNAICDEHDTVDIYMMSNYEETIVNILARNKVYTPNKTTGCWGNVVVDGTSSSVDVGKVTCKSIHLYLDLFSERSVGFNAQFLSYD